MCSRAIAWSDGERVASIVRLRTPVTLSTFRRGCPTWKSILQNITASSGFVVRSTPKPIAINLSDNCNYWGRQRDASGLMANAGELLTQK